MVADINSRLCTNVSFGEVGCRVAVATPYALAGDPISFTVRP
jgi:hypothetical protein